MKNLLIILLAVLVHSCTFESMFYQPYPLGDDFKIQDSLRISEVKIPGGEDFLHGILSRPNGESKGTILFLHGNAGNVSHRVKDAVILAEHGYSVLVIDYRGFGKSPGTTGHDELVADADTALRWLLKQDFTAGKPLIVLGRSIGGHLAVKICHDHPDLISAMIIEGAFTNHHDIAVDISPGWLQPFAFLLVRSKYKASSLIDEVNMPKLIIHSAEDEVIPCKMGEELYGKATGQKKFWKISGCHICGLRLFPDEYCSRIDSLIIMP